MAEFKESYKLFVPDEPYKLYLEKIKSHYALRVALANMMRKHYAQVIGELVKSKANGGSPSTEKAKEVNLTLDKPPEPNGSIVENLLNNESDAEGRSQGDQSLGKTVIPEPSNPLDWVAISNEIGEL